MTPLSKIDLLAQSVVGQTTPRLPVGTFDATPEPTPLFSSKKILGHTLYIESAFHTIHKVLSLLPILEFPIRISQNAFLTPSNLLVQGLPTARLSSIFYFYTFIPRGNFYESSSEKEMRVLSAYVFD